MPVELLEEPVVAEAEVPLKRYTTKLEVPTLGRAAQGGRTNWLTTSFMIAFHLGAIAALFFFSWSALAVSIVLYMFAVNVGIGMGYHRLLTHRGYKVPKWLEYGIAVCGTLALEAALSSG